MSINQIQSFQFIPWDSVEPTVLEASAQKIGSLKKSQIRQAVLENLQAFPWKPSYNLQSFSVSKQSLLDVNGAAVIAKFKRHPFVDTEYEQVTGMARFIAAGNEIIPAVLLFGTTSETISRHESIHLCQWLSPGLLNRSELFCLHSQNGIPAFKPLVSSNPDEAIDLMSRIVCHKIWTELEAYYWAEGKAGSQPEEVIKYAQRSALPFTTLERGLVELGIYKLNPLAMDICSDHLNAFCARTETEVPWVGELLKAAHETSLLDAMWWYKEEDEMEQMFGPLEEWGSEDQEA